LNEAIVLPGIRTSIRVVSLKPGVVRLGIEAPREVNVVRAELEDQQPRERKETSGLRRLTSDRLRTAGMALGLARLQLDAGQTEDVQRTLAQAHLEIQQLRKRLEPTTRRPTSHSRPRCRQRIPVGCTG
jgi:carbon storage regulator CsrA